MLVSTDKNMVRAVKFSRSVGEDDAMPNHNSCVKVVNWST